MVSGFVVAFWVDGELSERLSGDDVGDADVEVLDEEDDVGSGADQRIGALTTHRGWTPAFRVSGPMEWRRFRVSASHRARDRCARRFLPAGAGGSQPKRH